MMEDIENIERQFNFNSDYELDTISDDNNTSS